MSLAAKRLVPAAVVLVLGAGALTVTAAPIASAGTLTPAAVLSSVKAALAKQTGVHLVVTSKSGDTPSTLVADLAKTSGIETISSGKATATILVTPTSSYMGGNAAGLTTLFGLTAAQQKKVGTDWISMAKGTTQYADLAPGTTLSAVDGILPAAKGTTVTTETSGGRRLYLLKWTTAATSSAPKSAYTLTIAATGAPLPVEETAVASSVSGTTVFSKWGERVVVKVPAASSTIAFSKVAD